MRLIGLFLALALTLASLAAEGQETPKMAKIGLLLNATPTATTHLSEAFRQGMRDLGYVEGKSFVLELRYGEGRPERLPELARELVGLKLDVIVTAGADLTTAAVKRHTQTIPIVMVNTTDPVGTGSWRAWPALAATSQGSPISLRSSAASGWNC
jgi:putative tryptophan/tyrosine transport system substrate-binding protein